MNSYFASAERNEWTKVLKQISQLGESEIINYLMSHYSSVVAILNNRRQLLSINNHFLKLTGIEDTEDILGLRLGEALSCRYSALENGGCGTSEYCASCGAAIALVNSISHDSIEERLCVLKRKNGESDLLLKVKSEPIDIGSFHFYLLLMQDVTTQHHRALLERSFFHDINNMICGLQGACDLLNKELADSPIFSMLEHSVHRLKQEVEIQHQIQQTDCCHFTTRKEKILLKVLLDEIEDFYKLHPVSKDKFLDIKIITDKEYLNTDHGLLHRMLCNMLTNAFEASENGDRVELKVEDKGSLSFKVWNKQYIPHEIQLRIFQKNFSTKSEEGRGFGTYSMKILSEQALGGSISFQSTPDEGTSFHLMLP